MATDSRKFDTLVRFICIYSGGWPSVPEVIARLQADGIRTWERFTRRIERESKEETHEEPETTN